MASKSIKSAKRKADSLWSARIRKRNNGRCEICQKKANQPHHIIGRKNLSTRWVHTTTRCGLWIGSKKIDQRITSTYSGNEE